jgi:putative flippase GtrA
MIKKIKALSSDLYNHRFIRYVFVGGTTFVLDISLLVLLHSFLHINLAIATSLAYWIAIIYNFILNRWWAFSASENSSLRKHLPPYLVLLGFNYLFTVLFVGFVSRVIAYELAKVIAVPIQMIWTYPLYKRIFNPIKEALRDSTKNLRTVTKS